MEIQDDFLRQPRPYKCDTDVVVKTEAVADFLQIPKKELENDVNTSQPTDNKCYNIGKIKAETDLKSDQEVETSSVLTLDTPCSLKNISNMKTILLEDKIISCHGKLYYPTFNEVTKDPNQEHEENEVSLSTFSGQIVVSKGEVNKNSQYQVTFTGEKPYKCEICKSAYASRTGLTYHKRKHTGEKPYKCDMCPSLFASSSSLTIHKRQHTGEKPYKCNICLSSFTDSSHLKVHKKMHTGDHPYKCDICPSAFSVSSSLTVHKRKHTRENPYKCNMCPSAFGDTSSLTVHNRKHTGEKPYKCSLCPSAFTDFSSLFLHKRQHTAETP